MLWFSDIKLVLKICSKMLWSSVRKTATVVERIYSVVLAEVQKNLTQILPNAKVFNTHKNTQDLLTNDSKADNKVKND